MSVDFYVDEKLCISCGKCIRECGDHVEIQNSRHVNPDNGRCSRCFHCYTVCPENAIKLNEASNRIEHNQEIFSTINEENLTNFLAYRRSIRNFQRKPVEDAIVEKLVERARYIPSGGNAHSYEFTVLKSDKVRTGIMDELIRIYEMRSKLINNPVLRNVAKPFVNKQMRHFLSSRVYAERMKNLVERIFRGDDPFFYNAPVVIVIHSKDQIPTPKEDCILAGYNITLVAQALGLGACFVTLAQNAINSSKRCKDIIGLSPQDNVYAVIVLGYPGVCHIRISPKPEKAVNWR